MARPMALIVKIESSERPPRVSATRGMHSAPAARQAERLEASLRRVPTCKAWPGVKAASARPVHIQGSWSTAAPIWE